MRKLTLPAYQTFVEESSQAMLHAFAQLSQGNLTVEIDEPSENNPLGPVLHSLNNLMRQWREQNDETTSPTYKALEQQMLSKSRELDEALIELNAIRSRYLHQSWAQHATTTSKLHSYAIEGDQAESNTEAWLPVMTKAIEKAESAITPATENDASALAVPIYLHDEIIGVVGLTLQGEQGWSETELADVETVVNQLGSTLESQRLTHQTQVALNATELQAERMLQLYDMSQQFNEAHNVAAVFKVVAAHIPEIIATDHISVAWLNEKNATCDQHVLLDYMGNVATQSELPIKDTSLESIIEENMVIILPDTSRSRWADQQQQAKNGIRATLNVPLVVNGKVQGILKLGSREPNAYSQKDEAIMLQTASLLSATIENKQLIERLQASLKEAQALADISRSSSETQSFAVMLQQVVAALQSNELALQVEQVFLTRLETNQNNEPIWSEIIAVWHADDDPWLHPGDRYYLPELPLTALWVNNPDSYLMIEDTATDTRLPDSVRQFWLKQNMAARLLIPLYVKGRWAGQFSLSWREPQTFTEQDKRVYQALMGHLAPVVDNQRLFDEHQQLATIIEHHPDFIGIANMAGQTLYLNPNGLKMIGWSPNFDVQGTDIHDFYPPEDAEKVLTEGVPTALAEGSWTSEASLQTADGQTISVEQTIGINYASGGKPVSFSITMRNITDRKMAQATLAKQAVELQAVTRVSQAAATILNTQELLQRIVDLTATNFNLYQVQILVLDEISQMLFLKAGTGDIGTQMVAEGRQVALTQRQSIVALAGRSKQGVIVNNVDESARFLPDPMLPDVRSEMAVPLLIGNDLLGVVDIQSDIYDRFSEEDLAIQTTLAAQVTVALQNAQSFEKSEQVVQELNDLTRRLTRAGWDNYLTTTDQANHRLYYNLTQDQTLPYDNTAKSLAEPDLCQAIQIQGEPVGQIKATESAVFSREAAEIMTAVAERLGVHLENLRLSEQATLALNDTEQQASRLAALNNMATALNEAESNDMVYAILLKYVNDIVGGDVARIGLFNESDQYLQMYMPDSDYAVKAADIINIDQNQMQQIAGSRKVLVTNDAHQQNIVESQSLVEQGIYSSIIAPLTIGRIVIGTIHVGSSRTNAFAGSEENLMQQIASLGSTTLANLRLLQDTQSRAEREHRVRLITDKIRRSPDQASILQVARQEIGRILKASDSTFVLGTQAELLTNLNPDQVEQTSLD